jgi:hypothetical protein
MLDHVGSYLKLKNEHGEIRIVGYLWQLSNREWHAYSKYSLM